MSCADVQLTSCTLLDRYMPRNTGFCLERAVCGIGLCLVVHVLTSCTLWDRYVPRNTGFCLERAVCRTGVMSSCLCVNKLHLVGQVCA